VDNEAEEEVADIPLEEGNVYKPHTLNEDIGDKEEEEEDLDIGLADRGNAYKWDNLF
jgi:hypothetical protein